MLQRSSAHPFTSGILLCIKDHCILTAQAHQSPGPRDKSDSYWSGVGNYYQCRCRVKSAFTEMRMRIYLNDICIEWLPSIYN